MSEESEGGSLFRAVAADGAVRIIAVEVTAAADETRERHTLGPGSARVGADAVVAAALMSAHVKGDERMTLQIQGSDPRIAVYAEVDSEGVVRARVTPSDARPGDNGEISGVLVAAKANAQQEMYRGATEISDGNLEAALTEHLGASAQLDSVLRIRSSVVEGRVVAARGVLVEKLPGHADDTAGELRAISVLEVLRDRSTEEILEAIDRHELLGEPIDVLEWRSVRWRCRCSRQKVESTLIALGHEELEVMAAEDGGASVSCHFCNEDYRFTAGELRALAAP